MTAVVTQRRRSVGKYSTISLLKIAVVAIFNVAKLGAKLLAARTTTTYVIVLAWHQCRAAAC